MTRKSLSVVASGLLTTLILLFSLPALAALPPETRWADPTRVDLSVEFPGEGYHARWKLHRCDCGDLLVEAELNVPDEVVTGEILLVANRAVLTRGFDPYQEQAAASLDAAALMMQLALALLDRSEPAGPSVIDGAKEVELQDNLNPILLDTGSAVGSFLAPWSVKGEIKAEGEQQRRFDLRFFFTAGEPENPQQGEMRLTGLADFKPQPFPVAADGVLSGWGLDWRDEEDPLVGKELTAKNLAELRKKLQKR